MKHLGDITKINGAEIPVVDCITGGSPCQDLSVAGKRAGLDGERSGLFMEQIRIVKEMRKKEMENGRTAEFVRPRWMVWENVPGAFSSNGGKDFQAVLTEIVRIVEPECPDVPMPIRGGGASLDACTMNWAGGALLGEYTTHSFGECPREENASRLSQILEECVPQKYYLSARACQGILNRAKRRGKDLPSELKAALEVQAYPSKNDSASQGGQRNTAPIR